MPYQRHLQGNGRQTQQNNGPRMLSFQYNNLQRVRIQHGYAERMSQQAHEGCEVEEQVAERMRKGRTGVGMEGEGQQHEEQSNGGKGGQVVDVVDKGWSGDV